MPTAAKLIAAVLFFALCWLISEQIRSAIPPQSMGLFAPVNAAIGLIIGWRVVGQRAGQGFTASIGNGLTAICASFFWGILIWAGHTMLKASVRGRYSGPIDAIQDMFNKMVDFGALVVIDFVIATAVFGSIVCAILVEMASRRWP